MSCWPTERSAYPATRAAQLLAAGPRWRWRRALRWQPKGPARPAPGRPAGPADQRWRASPRAAQEERVLPLQPPSLLCRGRALWSPVARKQTGMRRSAAHDLRPLAGSAHYPPPLKTQQDGSPPLSHQRSTAARPRVERSGLHRGLRLARRRAARGLRCRVSSPQGQRPARAQRKIQISAQSEKPTPAACAPRARPRAIRSQASCRVRV